VGDAELEPLAFCVLRQEAAEIRLSCQRGAARPPIACTCATKGRPQWPPLVFVTARLWRAVGPLASRVYNRAVPVVLHFPS
jgi:hypothetical protein